MNTPWLPLPRAFLSVRPLLSPRPLRAALMLLLALLLGAAGCRGDSRQPSTPARVVTRTLTEARRGHVTRLVRQGAPGKPVPAPPAALFRVVVYPSPVGALAAYVTPDPGDGKKHPAVIWLAGGFENGIDETAWAPAAPENDQSARAFREAGLVLMLPSLRGGNRNPGKIEGFYGEVDDVLAAAAWLAKQSYVDPQRIYLGGHSTGGTLALLAAELGGAFRAVFAFGPAASIRSYGAENLPFDLQDMREVTLRSPVVWLGSIHTPAFVLEGTEKPSNLASLNALAKQNKNPLLRCLPVKGVNHFSILDPVTRLIAKKIQGDTGEKAGIGFEEGKLDLSAYSVKRP